MRPQEKAIDLWNRFLLYAETEIPSEADNNVRRCCIMCVDELIESSEWMNHKYAIHPQSNPENWKYIKNYWEDVKQEIEKL